jgi:hypothetical protein
MIRRAADGSRPSVEDVPPKGGDEHFAVDLASGFCAHLAASMAAAALSGPAVSSVSNSTLGASRRSRVHLTRIGDLGPEPDRVPGVPLRHQPARYGFRTIFIAANKLE